MPALILFSAGPCLTKGTNMKSNAKPPEKRFSATLQLRAPPRLFPLIDKAADARVMTASEYVRQAIVERLKADGIELEAV